MPQCVHGYVCLTLSYLAFSRLFFVPLWQSVPCLCRKCSLGTWSSKFPHTAGQQLERQTRRRKRSKTKRMHEGAILFKCRDTLHLSVCQRVIKGCVSPQAVWTANYFIPVFFYSGHVAMVPRSQVAGLICWHICYLLTPSRNGGEAPRETERAMRNQKVKRRRTHSLKCSHMETKSALPLPLYLLSSLALYPAATCLLLLRQPACRLLLADAVILCRYEGKSEQRTKGGGEGWSKRRERVK